MNFLLSILVWLLISAVLVVGLVLATKGTFWLLVAGTLVFILAFAKWGCASH